MVHGKFNFFSLNCFHNAAATDIDQKLQQRIEKETHTVYRHTHTTSTRTHSAQNNALIKILFSTKSEITPSRYENWTKKIISNLERKKRLSVSNEIKMHPAQYWCGKFRQIINIYLDDSINRLPFIGYYKWKFCVCASCFGTNNYRKYNHRLMSNLCSSHTIPAYFPQTSEDLWSPGYMT